jgi:hypothetical protein
MSEYPFIQPLTIIKIRGELTRFIGKKIECARKTAHSNAHPKRFPSEP